MLVIILISDYEEKGRLWALYIFVKVRWQLYNTLFTSHNWPHLMAPGPGAEEAGQILGLGPSFSINLLISAQRIPSSPRGWKHIAL